MKVRIIAVGRLREKAYRELADEYLKRLSRYGTYEEVELKDLPEPDNAGDADRERVKTLEGEAILRQIRPEDRVVALTIPGKHLTSEELAGRVAAEKNAGTGRLIFVIGGSLGLGDNVLRRADAEMSMSRMTFPHQLARVMLLEQLYRAEKINAGERYHK